jgi:hypothetical protein
MLAAGAARHRAAAEQARKEEEEMTPYTPQDLNKNWEFKILRCVTGRFRDPIWLSGFLQEEARAGWTMVEKFDDTRVRLKRPAGARANDATLGFDPYRTWVGMSQWRYPRRHRGCGGHIYIANGRRSPLNRYFSRNTIGQSGSSSASTHSSFSAAALHSAQAGSAITAAI